MSALGGTADGGRSRGGTGRGWLALVAGGVLIVSVPLLRLVDGLGTAASYIGLGLVVAGVWVLALAGHLLSRRRRSGNP